MPGPGCRELPDWRWAFCTTNVRNACYVSSIATTITASTDPPPAMSYYSLPNEILLDIATHVSRDPGDLNSFQQVDRRTYILLHPYFLKSYDTATLFDAVDSRMPRWISPDPELCLPDQCPSQAEYRKTLRTKFKERLINGDVLIKACANGWKRIAVAALRRGAPPRRRREVFKFRNDLNQWHEPLVSAAGGNFPSLELVRVLLDSGADVDILSNCDNPLGFETSAAPLHWAALRGELEIVKLLLSRGAVLDGRDLTNHTPLLYAVKGRPLNIDVVQVLLENGANPNAQGPRIGSPIMEEGARSDELVELMIEFGANLDRRSNGLPYGDRNDTVLHHCLRPYTSDAGIRSLRLLLEKVGYLVNAQNGSLQTPLHVAARYGLDDAVRVLLDSGARTDITNVAGETPLDVAMHNGHGGIVDILLET